MTKITATIQPGNLVIKAVGHANYAPHGQDIVCASISAILQTAVLGLQNLAEQYPDYVDIQIDFGTSPTVDGEPQSLE
jgi:uncharacterized protein YsxB (DUF464 family)